MVEAAGIEPETPTYSRNSKAGQNKSQSGHHQPQIGHPQEVTSQPLSKSRTEKGLIGSNPGLAGSTTRAQQEHNGKVPLKEKTPRESLYRVGPGDTPKKLFPSLPSDLQRVVSVWPNLPEEIKKSIFAIISVVCQ
jgi:hypothetical protein